jgi:hypothetical protein
MNRSLFIVISLVLFVVGLALVLSSLSLGREAVSGIIRAQGGSMDTGQYQIFLQEYIQTYRWIGILLSAIGGFGFVKAVELK